jgi:hypothetical protein
VNTYCGPFALGFILHKTPDEVAALVRRFRNYPTRVRGMWNYEVTNILFAQGRAFESFCCGQSTFLVDVARGRLRSWVPCFMVNTKQPTLAQWLKTRDKKGLYMLNITGHYIVVKGRKIFDNCYTHGIWAKQYDHQQSHVRAGWKILS